jgi:hypothetical protein
MSRIQERAREAIEDFDVESIDHQGYAARLQSAADKRGHGRQTAYAGVGGFLGGILGSFKGPLGAAVGALLGALFGALVGWDRDRRRVEARPRARVSRQQLRVRVPDVMTEVEADYVEVPSARRRRRAV